MKVQRPRYIIDYKDLSCARQPVNEQEAAERTDNFLEVVLGLDPEQAKKEAGRCLSCRGCLGCALCHFVCEPQAISLSEEEEFLELVVETVVFADKDETSVRVYYERANGVVCPALITML